MSWMSSPSSSWIQSLASNKTMNSILKIDNSCGLEILNSNSTQKIIFRLWNISVNWMMSFWRRSQIYELCASSPFSTSFCLSSYNIICRILIARWLLKTKANPSAIAVLIKVFFVSVGSPEITFRYSKRISLAI